MSGIQTITTKDNDVQLARKLNENFSYLQAVGGGGDIDTSSIDRQIVVINNAVSEKADSSAVKSMNQAIIKYLTSRYITTGTIEADTTLTDYLAANKISVDTAYVENLNATLAYIDTIDAESVEADKVTAIAANIGKLAADYIKANVIDADYIIAQLADVHSLTAEEIETKYANIDYGYVKTLLAKNAYIEDLVGGELNSVTITAGTINGAVINAGTINTAKINGQDVSVSLESLLADQHSTNESLQAQIDNNIQTWTGDSKPTSDTKPWTTGSDESHVGDIYFVTSGTEGKNGYCYRYAKSGNSYIWVLIEDNDITAALGRIDTLESWKTTTTASLSKDEESISSLVTKTETLEGTTSALSTKIIEDRQRMTAIEETAEGIKTSVTDAITTAEEYADNKVTTYAYSKSEIDQTAESITSSIETLDGKYSELKQTSDGFTITLGQAQKDIETAQSNANTALTTVNNLEIGGRNLLQGSLIIAPTTTDKGWWNNGATPELVTLNNETVLHASQTTASKTIPSFISRWSVNLEWGETYIYSGEIMIDAVWDAYASSTPLHYHVGSDTTSTPTSSPYNKGGGVNITRLYPTSAPNVEAGTWVKFAYSVKTASTCPDSTYPYPKIRPILYGAPSTTASVKEVWVRNVQVVRGTKATDWTPAPEDIQADIDTAQDTADEAKESANLTADGVVELNTKIKNTDTKVDEISTSLTDVTDKTTAISNRLDSEIKQEIEEAKKYATDYLSFSDTGLAIGSTQSRIYANIATTKFSFTDGTSDLAYFGAGETAEWTLNIEDAEISSMLHFGNYAWIKRENGHMTLKWVGDN